MNEFQEPEVLAELDRSFGENRQRLVLEKGTFRGRSTYCLRVLWQNDAGEWRWQPAKPSSKGNTWQALNLKAKELRQLGLAFTAEADELERESTAQRAATEPRATRPRSPTARKQRELDRFDDGQPPFRGTDGDVPF